MPGNDDFDLDAALSGDTSMTDEDDGTDESPTPPKKPADATAGAGDAAPPPDDADSAAERTDPNIRVDELSAGGATGGSGHGHGGTPPQAGVPTPQDYYAACAEKTRTGTALAPPPAPTAQDYYAACAANQKKEGGK